MALADGDAVSTLPARCLLLPALLAGGCATWSYRVEGDEARRAAREAATQEELVVAATALDGERSVRLRLTPEDEVVAGFREPVPPELARVPRWILADLAPRADQLESLRYASWEGSPLLATEIAVTAAFYAAGGWLASEQGDATLAIPIYGPIAWAFDVVNQPCEGLGCTGQVVYPLVLATGFVLALAQLGGPLAVLWERSRLEPDREVRESFITGGEAPADAGAPPRE